MKFKIIGILLIGGILMFSCSENSGGASSATPVNISGKVQDGYRHLSISLKSDSTKLVVYRGDYVKFYLDDKGDPQVEYSLNVPELDINAVLKDNTLEQPFFKMKVTGQYCMSSK